MTLNCQVSHYISGMTFGMRYILHHVTRQSLIFPWGVICPAQKGWSQALLSSKLQRCGECARCREETMQEDGEGEWYPSICSRHVRQIHHAIT